VVALELVGTSSLLSRDHSGTAGAASAPAATAGILSTWLLRTSCIKLVAAGFRCMGTSMASCCQVREQSQPLRLVFRKFAREEPRLGLTEHIGRSNPHDIRQGAPRLGSLACAIDRQRAAFARPARPGKAGVAPASGNPSSLSGWISAPSAGSGTALCGTQITACVASGTAPVERWQGSDQAALSGCARVMGC
jgi:hypothetical protein